MSKRLTKKDTARFASKSDEGLRVYLSCLKGPTIAVERAKTRAELRRRHEALLRELTA